MNDLVLHKIMARKMNKNNLSHYKCKECDMAYPDKEIAEKCENWCKKHKSCNIEIIKYAINQK